MELRINCDAQVKINKMSTISKINCEVIDYNIEKDNLQGNIKFFGEYITDDVDKNYPFSEIIPITVVFRSSDFDVNEIYTDKLYYQEIFNQGIECNFDLVIIYQEKQGDEPLETLEETIEDETIELIEEEKLLDKIEQHLTNEEPLELIEPTDEIKQKYDELLNEVLNKRCDNFLEEPNHNIETIESDEEFIIPNLMESYHTYHIYYTKDEKDLEEIAKKEKVSIDKIYKDNPAISDNRRIIIK